MNNKHREYASIGIECRNKINIVSASRVNIVIEEVSRGREIPERVISVAYAHAIPEELLVLCRPFRSRSAIEYASNQSVDGHCHPWTLTTSGESPMRCRPLERNRVSLKGDRTNGRKKGRKEETEWETLDGEYYNGIKVTLIPRYGNAKPHGAQDY
ncbi:hypothetical protein EVAR_48794_1 [Eumeta japonica]|uniref:Uncharacterized protein n=1 Tax=Eumeta variegata TaxID=151549 RepID=A0A4C2A793_EUMVA|nr:hypothetical protein EVAR_48794_1 [Eumeta japonica]